MQKELKKSLVNNLADKNVILFWSGGFESTFLLEFVIKNKIYEICQMTVLCVAFPQEIYVDSRIEALREYSKKINIKIVVLKPQEVISHDYPYAKACGKCKEIRREIILQYLNEAVFNQNAETVFMTGHNLDDLASYTLELIAKRFNKAPEDNRHRLVECTNKFFETFRYSDEIVFYRPLFDKSVKELALIKEDNEALKITNKKCYWINQRKRILQEYIGKSEIDLSYENVKAVFLQYFDMPNDEEFRSISFDTYLM